MKRMGRVFKRRDIWWIAYCYRGKEYRESSRSEKESDAWKFLKQRLGEIGTGNLIGPVEEKVVFEDLAKDFINDYEINRKRSIRSARLSVSHLQAFFGMDRALNIRTDRVRKYISQRQEERAANASINRELAALKRMFSLAKQAGKLSATPYIPTLEENNARRGFLDHGSFLALRDNLPDYLKDPVTFLYISGWRVSEMKTLEWRDVDLQGGMIRLRAEVSKNKDGRPLPLDGELHQLIKRARQEKRPDVRFVFHFKGQPIGDFRKSWKKACQAVGLERCLIHDLRRTAVRNLVRSGVRENVAMRLTGHKTRSIFDRYDIVNEDDLTQGIRKVQAHLERQPKECVVVPLKKAV